MLFYVLWSGLWNKVLGLATDAHPIPKQVGTTSQAYFSALAVIVTTTALQGKVGLFQCIVVAVIQTCLYSINQYICRGLLLASDAGGGILIHAFGGASSVVLCMSFIPRQSNSSKSYVASKESKYIAVLGAMVIWATLPSFNCSAITAPLPKYYAYANTLLALSASTIASLAQSQLIFGRFDITNFVQSALSGGIGVATSAEFILNPAAAIVCGLVCGIICTLIQHYLHQYLWMQVGVLDSGGVINGSLFPGIFGGFYSAIIVGFLAVQTLPGEYPPLNRPIGLQALVQIIATVVSILLGSASGFFISKVLLLNKLRLEQYMEQGSIEQQQQIAYLPYVPYFDDFAEWLANIDHLLTRNGDYSQSNSKEQPIDSSQSPQQASEQIPTRQLLNNSESNIALAPQ